MLDRLQPRAALTALDAAARLLPSVAHAAGAPRGRCPTRPRSRPGSRRRAPACRSARRRSARSWTPSPPAASLPPLRPADLAGTPVGARLDPLLTQRGGELARPGRPARRDRPAPARGRARGRPTRTRSYIDMRTELGGILVRLHGARLALARLERGCWCCVVLGAGLRRPADGAARARLGAGGDAGHGRRADRLSGVRLSLIHLVALQLVAGVGLDYALFFARRQLDGEERARTLRTLVTCNAMTLLTFGLLACCQTPLLRDIGVDGRVRGRAGHGVRLPRHRRGPGPPHDAARDHRDSPPSARSAAARRAWRRAARRRSGLRPQRFRPGGRRLDRPRRRARGSTRCRPRLARLRLPQQPSGRHGAARGRVRRRGSRRRGRATARTGSPSCWAPAPAASSPAEEAYRGARRRGRAAGELRLPRHPGPLLAGRLRARGARAAGPVVRRLHRLRQQRASLHGRGQPDRAPGCATRPWSAARISLCRMTLHGFQALELISPDAVPSLPRRRAPASRSARRPGSRCWSARAAGLALLGAGASSDGHHMSSPHPEGAGAVAAMRQALEAAGLAARRRSTGSTCTAPGPAPTTRRRTLAVAAVFGDARAVQFHQGLDRAHAGRMRHPRGGAGGAMHASAGSSPGCLGVDAARPGIPRQCRDRD